MHGPAGQGGHSGVTAAEHPELYPGSRGERDRERERERSKYGS